MHRKEVYESIKRENEQAARILNITELLDRSDSALVEIDSVLGWR